MSAGEHNARAWGHVVDFFDHERATTEQVYPSEWFFLKDLLKEGISVLDVGCAQGGFAGVLAENLTDFRYTGIDINAGMIERARHRHPGQHFHVVGEDDWPVLGGARFDLVLVLGILHLHESWRDTIARAWAHTAGTLLMDLREYEGATIEDKAVSSFRMDFGTDGAVGATVALPYVIVNAADALATVRRLTPGAGRLSQFGYLHPVSRSAVTPVDRVMANVWCVQR
jgi:SAM-dependent methyltransferase